MASQPSIGDYANKDSALEKVLPSPPSGKGVGSSILDTVKDALTWSPLKLLGSHNASAAPAQSNATPTSDTSTTGATTPGGLQSYNPLAVNLYYSTTVAPLIAQLQKQLMGQNTSLGQLAAANPFAQYIPQNMQQGFNTQAQHILGGQNDLITAMANSVANAPAVDQTLSQQNAIQNAVAQDYALQRYNEALGGAAGTANPFTSSTTLPPVNPPAS
jgi:hypothetical protein